METKIHLFRNIRKEKLINDIPEYEISLDGGVAGVASKFPIPVTN
jgi:hypothetical protein